MKLNSASDKHLFPACHPQCEYDTYRSLNDRVFCQENSEQLVYSMSIDTFSTC